MVNVLATASDSVALYIACPEPVPPNCCRMNRPSSKSPPVAWNLMFRAAIADCTPAQGEAERCLRVFKVGMPVYSLFLGRQDASGA